MSNDLQQGPPDSLVRAVSKLDEAPVEYCSSSTQRQFDQARVTAIAEARNRLTQRLSIQLGDPLDGIKHGVIANYQASASWYSTLRLTVERGALASALASSSSDLSTAGLRPTTTTRLVAGAETRVIDGDAIEPHRLFADLDDGWMLVAENPAGLDSTIADLLFDLTMGFGAAAPIMSYGIRSALGPPPMMSTHPRLLIQLVGVRAVLFQGGEHPNQQQAQMQPGLVTLMPADYSAAHLPLDEDTAYLDVALTKLDFDADAPIGDDARIEMAMVPTVQLVADDAATRQALRGASEQAWAMRLVAPGGVHVLRELDEVTELVVAGHRVDVSAKGVELLAQLADARPMTVEALVERSGSPKDQVGDAVDALWRAGLLQPVPVAKSAVTNERLTQVASADLSESGLVAAVLSGIDPNGWRSLDDGEVFADPSLDVAVQTLAELADPSAVAQIQDVAATLNARFFGADVIGARLEDPPLVVRVRPGSGATVAEIGSDLVAHSTRKITWVFSLSDADSPLLHIPAGSPAPAGSLGLLAAFASLRPWKLAPVESGERLLLLGRLHGAAFS